MTYTLIVGLAKTEQRASCFFIKNGLCNDNIYRFRINILGFLDNFPTFYVLCGLVVGVPGYGSRGPVSIPGATWFSEK
jgi:hypothetical protein